MTIFYPNINIQFKKTGKFLGCGSQGTVYEGINEESKERVAIKIIHGSSLSPIPDEVWREFRALENLKHHPHIIG